MPDAEAAGVVWVDRRRREAGCAWWIGAPSVTIRYEQAVYGSFPFWDKGYAVLAQSPGCRPEWLAELREACQRFGERPGGVAEAEVRGLFALRLASGPGPG